MTVYRPLLQGVVLACMLWVVAYTVIEPFKEIQRDIRDMIPMDPIPSSSSVEIFTYTITLIMIPAVIAPILIYTRSGSSKSNRLPARLWRTWTLPLFGLGDMHFSIIETIILAAWTALLTFAMYKDVTTSLVKYENRGGATDVDKMYRTGRAFGRIGMINFAIFLIPVSKSSFWLQLFGMGFDHAIRIHRYLGVGVLTCIIIHSVLIMRRYDWGLGEGTHYTLNCFGLVSTCGALLLMFTSIPWVRRNYYQVFYYCHVIGFLLFLVFGAIHDRVVINHVLPALATWIADKLIGATRRYSRVTVVQTVVLNVGDIKVVRFRVACDARLPVKAGSYMMVNCPAASQFGWHPISVAWTQNVGGVQVIDLDIRSMGKWSDAVVEAVLKTGTSTALYLNGPTGTSHQHNAGYMTHPTAFLACSGIGLTPMLLAMSELSTTESSTSMVWVVRSREMLDMYRPQLEDAVKRGDGRVHVDVCLTGKVDEEAGESKSMLKVDNLDHSKKIYLFNGGLAGAGASAFVTFVLGGASIVGMMHAYYILGDGKRGHTFLMYAMGLILAYIAVLGPLSIAFVYALRYGFRKTTKGTSNPGWAGMGAVTADEPRLKETASIGSDVSDDTSSTSLDFSDAKDYASVNVVNAQKVKDSSIHVHVMDGQRPSFDKFVDAHLERSVRTKAYGVGICGGSSFKGSIMSALVAARRKTGVEMVVDEELFLW